MPRRAPSGLSPPCGPRILTPGDGSRSGLSFLLPLPEPSMEGSGRFRFWASVDGAMIEKRTSRDSDRIMISGVRPRIIRSGVRVDSRCRIPGRPISR